MVEYIRFKSPGNCLKSTALSCSWIPLNCLIPACSNTCLLVKIKCFAASGLMVHGCFNMDIFRVVTIVSSQFQEFSTLSILIIFLFSSSVSISTDMTITEIGSFSKIYDSCIFD